MGPCEAEARAAARRYVHRSNPASLRLARVAVELACRADADGWRPSSSPRDPLRHVLADLAECGHVEDVVDSVRARRWERRRGVALEAGARGRAPGSGVG